MEEFLIQANKKQRVEFLTQQGQLHVEMEVSGAVLKQELSILRNGWGYTVLHVECRGDFFLHGEGDPDRDGFSGQSLLSSGVF